MAYDLLGGGGGLVAAARGQGEQRVKGLEALDRCRVLKGQLQQSLQGRGARGGLGESGVKGLGGDHQSGCIRTRPGEARVVTELEPPHPFYGR